jgi:hydrogenase/urease accessory protein HupE
MTARKEEHSMNTPSLNPTPSRLGARMASGLAVALSAGAALAHPGHDSTPMLGLLEGLVHLLTEPDHLAMLAIAVIAGVAGARAWRARRASRRDSPADRH